MNDLRLHALRSVDVQVEQLPAKHWATVSHVTCACCAKSMAVVSLACCRSLLRFSFLPSNEWETSFSLVWTGGFAWHRVCTLQRPCQPGNGKAKGPPPRQVTALSDVRLCVCLLAEQGVVRTHPRLQRDRILGHPQNLPAVVQHVGDSLTHVLGCDRLEGVRHCSHQLADGLADGDEHGLMCGLLLHRLRIDHRLSRRLLPCPEIGKQLLSRQWHAVDVTSQATVGSLDFLTGRTRGVDDLAARLAVGLGPGERVLRTEVAALVVADVGMNRLDDVLSHLGLVSLDDRGHLTRDGVGGGEAALAGIAAGDQEALGIQRVAVGHRHTEDLGLLVNGSLDFTLASGLGLGLLLAGHVAADDRLGHLGLHVHFRGRGGVDVGGHDEREDVGEIHGGGSCGLGWRRGHFSLWPVMNGSRSFTWLALAQRQRGMPFALFTFRAAPGPEKKKGRRLSPPPPPQSPMSGELLKPVVLSEHVGDVLTPDVNGAAREHEGRSRSGARCDKGDHLGHGADLGPVPGTEWDGGLPLPRSESLARLDPLGQRCAERCVVSVEAASVQLRCVTCDLLSPGLPSQETEQGQLDGTFVAREKGENLGFRHGNHLDLGQDHLLNGSRGLIRCHWTVH